MIKVLAQKVGSQRLIEEIYLGIRYFKIDSNRNEIGLIDFYYVINYTPSICIQASHYCYLISLFFLFK